MADITQRNQGEMGGEGKVNWRGDQVALTPGDQSIYKSSTIQLAQLGARKVVGDRVFRYARAGLTPIQCCMVCAPLGTGGTGGATGGNYINISTSGTGAAGSYVIDVTNPDLAMGVNDFAEGYILVKTGADQTEGGYLYRIKNNDAIAISASGQITLYDPLLVAITVTDPMQVVQNLYMDVGSATAANAVVGVAPISVTTNDYFWLQTWGPAAVQAMSAMSVCGGPVFADTGGAVQQGASAAGDDASLVGMNLTTCPAVSQSCVVFVTIAP